MITLRPPRMDELADLSALCLRSKAHWGYDAAFMAACREELTLTEAGVAAMPTIVAEDSGRAAGVAQVARDGADADLWKLFVDPGAMGKGVGRALFDWCTEAARGLGAGRLLIEADPDAAPFYRRMGAVVIGDAPSGSIPGRRLPLLEYPLR